MSELPEHFLADLRYPTTDRDFNDSLWSQWSTLPMIEMSAMDTYHFVREAIVPARQRILEIGCGNGYLTLELARDDHDVTGLDLSQDIIKVAERAREKNPDKATTGPLRYICADFTQWEAAPHSFDVIIFNRVLHHMHELRLSIAKVKTLLREGGLLICQDYGYDRFDDKTACWLYQMQRLLFLSGHYSEDPATAAGEAQSIEAVKDGWHERARDHGLNRYDEMYTELSTSFHRQSFAWVPYLFIYIGNGIRNASPGQERVMLTFLRDTEELLIDKGLIQAVGFRFVGRS